MLKKGKKNTQEYLAIRPKTDIGDVVEYVNVILDTAIQSKVSDIHVEPMDDTVGIRYRESGDFWYLDKISQGEYQKVLSRIKILAQVRIDEKQKPQDGKIPYTSIKL
jgi:type IV pilus assembly protein PilB